MQYLPLFLIDLFSDDDIDISTTEINPSPVFVGKHSRSAMCCGY